MRSKKERIKLLSWPRLRVAQCDKKFTQVWDWGVDLMLISWLHPDCILTVYLGVQPN